MIVHFIWHSLNPNENEITGNFETSPKKISLSQGAPGINETGRATKTIAPRISNKVSEEEAPRVGQSALLWYFFHTFFFLSFHLESHSIAVAFGSKKERSKLLCFMNFKLHTTQTLILFLPIFQSSSLSPLFCCSCYLYLQSHYVRAHLCQRGDEQRVCEREKRKNMENHFVQKKNWKYRMLLHIMTVERMEKFHGIWVCNFSSFNFYVIAFKLWGEFNLNLWWRDTRNCVGIFLSFFGLLLLSFTVD